MAFASRDGGPKNRGGCSLRWDTAQTAAGTRPPVPGPGRAAPGPRASVRGQLGAVNGPRPPASWALGVCDPSSQTGSQTQTRPPASWARLTASWAQSSELGPCARSSAPGQLGPASWAQSSGRGHRITVNGARPTGPGLTAGHVFDNRTLSKVYLRQSTMYWRAGPGLCGRKKTRPYGPGHAAQLGHATGKRLNELENFARFGFKINAVRRPLNRARISGRTGYGVPKGFNRTALVDDVRVFDSLGHARAKAAR